MSGTLEVGLEIMPDVKVGDTVTVVVTGVVSNIDGDLVDVRGFSGGPQFLTGSPKVTIVATRAQALPEAPSVTLIP